MTGSRARGDGVVVVGVIQVVILSSTSLVQSDPGSYSRLRLLVIQWWRGAIHLSSSTGYL